MTSKVLQTPPRPGTPEWAKIVSASKVPTILGLNPFETPGELWMVMSGLAQPEHLEGDHLDWGHVAEDSLARWWKHKNPGWLLSPGEVTYTNHDLPFANIATLDRRGKRGRSYHIIECKTSNSTQTWAGDELPQHVAAQVLAQMGISGIHEATVVAQLHSTVPRLYDVTFDPELWAGVVDEITAFTETLGNAEPPAPDPALLEAIAKNAQPTPTDGDATVELTPENPLVEELREAKAQLDAAKDRLETAKAQLSRRGAGRTVTVDGKKLAYPKAGRFAANRVPKDARHLLKDPAVMTAKLDPKKLQKAYPEVYNAAIGDWTYTYSL